jgi:predicted RNA-binding protein YlxR (DUF448 family)
MANIPKKIPERRCVGCGEHFPKKELIRIVRKPDGEVVLDLTGKANGRGAYLCRSEKCLLKARKSGRLANSLSCAIDESVYEAVAAELMREVADE